MGGHESPRHRDGPVKRATHKPPMTPRRQLDHDTSARRTPSEIQHQRNHRIAGQLESRASASRASADAGGAEGEADERCPATIGFSDIVAEPGMVIEGSTPRA